MTRARPFVVLSSLLGIASCFMIYRQVRAADPPVVRATANGPGAGVGASDAAAQLNELRQELARLRGQIQVQVQRTGEPEPREHGDPRTDPEARDEAERAHHEMLAGVDAAYRKEPIDPRWSTAATSAVQLALAADAQLAALGHGVECRSRSCRLVLADDGSGHLDKQIPVFVQQLAGELPSMVADRIVEPGGATTMVLYLSRGS